MTNFLHPREESEHLFPVTTGRDIETLCFRAIDHCDIEPKRVPEENFYGQEALRYEIQVDKQKIYLFATDFEKLPDKLPRTLLFSLRSHPDPKKQDASWQIDYFSDGGLLSLVYTHHLANTSQVAVEAAEELLLLYLGEDID